MKPEENSMVSRFGLSGILLAFAALWAWLTLTGKLEGLDRPILLGLRESTNLADPIGPKWLETVMIAFTHIGGSLALIILTVASLVWLVAKARRAEAIRLFVIAGGAFAMTPLLKLVFGRARPDLVEHLVHAGSNSFPSGHALRSAVVYMAIATLVFGVRKCGSAHSLFLLLIATIGLSRVYVGVHWPSDIVGGWLIAATWLSLWRHKA